MRSSSLERRAGVSLFVVVTASWVLWLAAVEQGWVGMGTVAFVLAVAVSAVSVVVTGYLGRLRDALWLGWIPGATTTAIGFAMTPTPGGDEIGGGMIFLGGLLLAGWVFFFLPLIALGVALRRARERRSSSTSASSPS